MHIVWPRPRGPLGGTRIGVTRRSRGRHCRSSYSHLDARGGFPAIPRIRNDQAFNSCIKSTRARAHIVRPRPSGWRDGSQHWSTPDGPEGTFVATKPLRSNGHSSIFAEAAVFNRRWVVAPLPRAASAPHTARVQRKAFASPPVGRFPSALSIRLALRYDERHSPTHDPDTTRGPFSFRARHSPRAQIRRKALAYPRSPIRGSGRDPPITKITCNHQPILRPSVWLYLRPRPCA